VDPGDGTDAHEADDATGLPWIDDDADAVAGDGRGDAGNPFTEGCRGGVIERRSQVDGGRGRDGGKTRASDLCGSSGNRSAAPLDAFA
jgi:hypothetical protein